MPTMNERRENTATLLVSLGEIRPDATPAERDAAVQALTDANIDDRCDKLLARLGHPDYKHPAAA
jgi:hypothetical protein